MSDRQTVSARGQKQARWLCIGIGVGLIAPTLRLVVVLVNMSQTGGGLADVAILVLVLVGSACGVVLVLWFALHRHRRQLRAIRRLFPSGTVEQTTILPATFDSIEDAAPHSRLKINRAAAVVLGVRSLTIWSGVRKPKKLADVRSEEAITYRVGALEHYGREHPAILATVRVGGKHHTIPFVVLSATSKAMKLAAGDELEDLVALIPSPRQSAPS